MIETIQSNSGIIATLAHVFTVIGGIVALAAFLLNIKNSKKNALGEKKQRTIEFYRGISGDCNVLLNKAIERHTERGIIDYGEAKKDNEIFKAIRGYLSIMEEFSVGINNDVFDIDIFGQTAGVHSRIWHKRFEKIIDGIRNEDGRKTLFAEFETMVGNIKKLQEKKGYTDDWLNAIINKPQKSRPAEDAHTAKLSMKPQKENILDVSQAELIEYTNEMAAIRNLGFENRDYIFTHPTTEN